MKSIKRDISDVNIKQFEKRGQVIIDIWVNFKPIFRIELVLD